MCKLVELISILFGVVTFHFLAFQSLEASSSVQTNPLRFCSVYLLPTLTKREKEKQERKYERKKENNYC